MNDYEFDYSKIMRVGKRTHIFCYACKNISACSGKYRKLKRDWTGFLPQYISFWILSPGTASNNQNCWISWPYLESPQEMHLNNHKHAYNLINNFSIIACGARRSCASAYLLTGAQHTLHAGIVRVDRSLFHQIIVLVQ